MMYTQKMRKNPIMNLGIAAATGAAIYMIANNSMGLKQIKLKRSATKAIRSIGTVVNSISAMLK